MLIEFRVANFRSFCEEQVLSLVASNDKEIDKNCTTRGKLRFLKAVGIYGPNASGKSNLIKAVDFMRETVLKSANTKPDESLNVTPFLLDDKSKRKASFFEITFYEKHVRYQYGFTAKSKYIQDEWLFAYPKGRARLWYERSFNHKTNKPIFKFGGSLGGDKTKLAKMTRLNSLFLSVGAQWNNKQLATIYKWFNNNLRIVPPKEYFKPITAKMLLELESKPEAKKAIYDFITSALKDADLGICGLDVKKIDVDEIRFLESIPEEDKRKLIERLKKEPLIQVEVHHRNKKANKIVSLILEDESDGTQRFFQLLGPWLETLSYGYTVFIDELETSLHPLLVRELIKVVQDPKSNKYGAQLIFATHDTTLLDHKIFRRDQIWFTEKDEDGGTKLYPLSDYKPRKGEAMQKGYLSGRYGAIPIIEEFKLNA